MANKIFKNLVEKKNILRVSKSRVSSFSKIYLHFGAGLLEFLHSSQDLVKTASLRQKIK